jgi:hypothetical protein
MTKCIHCPMVYDPAKAGQPATDGRGGVYTGWSLQEGAALPEPHEHEFETCGRTGCIEPVDDEDGFYCSGHCRTRDFFECGP